MRSGGRSAGRTLAIAAGAAVLVGAGPARGDRPGDGAPRAELGGFAGVFLPDEAHELYDPAAAEQVPLRAAGADLGLRVAFYPLRFLAIEGEVDLLPQETRAGDRVLAYGARAHLLVELPGRVAPFALAGLGTLGIRSDDDVLGHDRDAAGHLGLGLKVRIAPRLSLRLEGRAVRAPRAGVDSGTVHGAALLGIAWSLGGGDRQVAPSPPRPVVVARAAPAPVPPPPPAPEPEPAPPDGDQDGAADDADRCPLEAGPAASQGCPDRDGDGVDDRGDTCPDQTGTAALHGCATAPRAFLDGDHIVLAEPLTFRTSRDLLRPRSRPILDEVAAVLRAHPELVHLRVAGHTDDRGDDDRNRELSRKRAEAVRQYLIGRGVAADRIEAVGVGEAEPIDSNQRAAGRARNRRVELQVSRSAP